MLWHPWLLTIRKLGHRHGRLRALSLMQGSQGAKQSLRFKAASSSHGERLQQADLALHELLEATL